MKTSDQDVQTLLRHLKDEAASLRQRAKRLEAIASATAEIIKDCSAQPRDFEYVAQEAIDVATHRSTIHLYTIARTCATLAAQAAVERRMVTQ